MRKVLAVLALVGLSGCSENGSGLGNTATPPPPPVTQVASAIAPAPVLPVEEPAPPADATVPLEFKGDLPGAMTVAEFKTKYPKVAVKPGSVTGEEKADFFELGVSDDDAPTAAGSKLLSLRYTFLDGKLEGIRGTAVALADYSAMRDAFATKYGPPQLSEAGKAPFSEWRNGSQRIRLHGSQSCLISFYDESLRVALKDRRTAAKAKDL